MANDLPGSLTEERRMKISDAIAESFFRDHFRFMPASEYRRRLGKLSQHIGNGITADELHLYMMSRLSATLGEMFGYDRCSVSFSSSKRD